jgi:hypothetical protein
MSDQTTTIVSLEVPPEMARVPLVGNNRSLSWITDNVSKIVEERTVITGLKWIELIMKSCFLTDHKNNWKYV